MVQTAEPTSASVGSTTSMNSRKVYVRGSRADIRVPAREIDLTATGDVPNAPVRLYDTSGPYTDPDVRTDIRAGLAPVRGAWIRERGDVEEYTGRDVRAQDNGLRPDDPRANLETFPGLRRRTLRALSGKNVSQMHYARRGIVTPEMEFVAIREGVEPDFVREEVACGRAIIPANVNHPETE